MRISNHPFGLPPYLNYLLSFPYRAILYTFSHLVFSLTTRPRPNSAKQLKPKGMSTASATVSPLAAMVACPGRSPPEAKRRVVFIGGMSSFAGLKAHNSIVSMGQPVCTNYSFAMYMKSLKAAAKRRGNGGGAISARCSAAAEIFKIAAIMNGLVLIGVAVGFVLLRVEAWIEESES